MGPSRKVIAERKGCEKVGKVKLVGLGFCNWKLKERDGLVKLLEGVGSDEGGVLNGSGERDRFVDSNVL